MKRPYLIVAHDYRRQSAGVRALHRLCHHLNEAGYDAFVETPHIHPDWNEKTADESLRLELARDGIVVYPEVEEGNNLQAQRVVRFILNAPGLIRGSGVFCENEILFGYCGLMRRYLRDEMNILTVPVAQTNLFRTESDQSMRAGGLYWIGKEATTAGPEAEGWLQITLDWPVSWEQLSELFRRRGLFISYTMYTHLLVEARLCGCPAAVIPNGRYNRLEFGFGTPGGMDGLAWGITPDEISRAVLTVERYPEAYNRNVVGRYLKQLDRFIQITQRWEH